MALRALQSTASGTGPVGGSGTIDTIPRWSGASTLGDSLLSQSGAIVTNGGTFRAASGTVSEPGYTFSASSGTGMYRATSDAILRFGVSGSYAFGVTAAGNFGINTPSPAFKLDVAGTVRVANGTNFATNDGGVLLQSGNGYKIGFDSIGSTVGYIRYNVDTAGTTIHGHVFSAGAIASPTNLMLIRGDGNVGIGTTSPLWKNHTVGAGLLLSGTAYNLAAVNQDQSTYRGVSLGYDTSGQIGVIASTGASSSLAFWTNNAGTWGERARIDSSGNLILNTATTGATIQAAGSQQGLKLPATPGNTDTQALDCYQENAAWTPALTGFGGTAPTVFASTCTRIGRMVICNIVLTATGGNTYSASYATPTTISLPVASAALCAATLAQGTNQVPNATVSGGNILVPTFALTTVATVITATYYV